MTLILHQNRLLKGSKLIRKHIITRLEEINLESYGTDLQGVFINLDILNIDFVLNKINETNFSKRFMKNGLLFIWTHKTRIYELIKLLESKKFMYAENLVFSQFSFELVNRLLKDLQTDNSVFSESAEGDDGLLPYDEVIETLMRDGFDLRNGEELTDYLVKIPSEFISSNKNTLLVFRRVS